MKRLVSTTAILSLAFLATFALPERGYASGSMDCTAADGSSRSYADIVMGFEAAASKPWHSTNPSSSATGAYQLTAAALVDAGFITKASSGNAGKGTSSWSGVVWTDKAQALGVNSRDDFFNNQNAQNVAFAAFTQTNVNYVKQFYTPGQVVNGVPMSDGAAGVAAHMLGMGGFQKWAESGFSPSGLNAADAAAHNMSPEEYNNHLMQRMAAGGCADPSLIEQAEEGGAADVDKIPEIILMPWKPDQRPATIMPGQIRSLLVEEYINKD